MHHARDGFETQPPRALGMPGGSAARCLAGCIVLLCCVPLLARETEAKPGEPDPRRIHLAGGSFDPLSDALPAERWRRAVPGHQGEGFIIQFEAPITGADRRRLEDLGARIGGSLPVRALEAVLTESQRSRAEALPGVRWVGRYREDWKLPTGLRARLEEAEAREPGPMALRISLFAGTGAAGVAELRRMGARVLHRSDARAFSLVDVEIPLERLDDLLALPQVRFVQPVPVRILHNDRARHLTGLATVADDLFASGLDASLDGRDEASGFQVKYGHTDSGIWTPHPGFQTGLANGWITWETGSDLSDSGGHGTHTAGSLVGDGSDWASIPEVPPGSGAVAADRWRGVQPEAALHHLSNANVIDNRHVFETHVLAGAQISTNSWGLAECAGCAPITDYDSSAAMWDEGVWDADDQTAGLQPLLAFFAAGNLIFPQFESLNGCMDPFFGGASDSISTPATAKNVITISASETDRTCGFVQESDHPGDVMFTSARGPVDPDGTGQGLFKPDLVAVGGSAVLSAERDGTGGAASPSGFDDPTYCSDSGPSYRFEGGTSMACPLAAGIGGVLYQDLVVNRGIPAPAPSLVKAMLVNGALAIEPSGSCGYGYETTQTWVSRGWGLVQGDTSLYGASGSPSLRDVAFENEVTGHALATGETHEVIVDVAPAAPFKVTLVWTDFPAAAGVGSPLVVNDLDLEVSGPDGLFLGNNFDPADDDWSAALVPAVPDPPTPAANDVHDRYNVVENVYVESPTGGSYTIRVRAYQVSQDQEPDLPGVNQDFSLVWSSPSVDEVPLPEPGTGSGLLAGVLLLAALARLTSADRRKR